jgi:hypothetical protein
MTPPKGGCDSDQQTAANHAKKARSLGFQPSYVKPSTNKKPIDINGLLNQDKGI